jgi:carboxypeptidase C (cathepsin A)
MVRIPSHPIRFLLLIHESDARSFLATLSDVVASGIQTVIWAGDADWICNWFGGFDVANAIQYSGSATFSTTAVQNYTVSGKAGGEFKTVDNLSWLRVFGAGHEVPYYREFITRSRESMRIEVLTSFIEPEVALQVFKQTLSKKPLSST